jgi:hypothetical protein
MALHHACRQRAAAASAPNAPERTVVACPGGQLSRAAVLDEDAAAKRQQFRADRGWHGFG